MELSEILHMGIDAALSKAIRGVKRPELSGVWLHLDVDVLMTRSCLRSTIGVRMGCPGLSSRRVCVGLPRGTWCRTPINLGRG